MVDETESMRRASIRPARSSTLIIVHPMPTMTAQEAAQRMGVKVETLYAYVSRGLLHREVGGDGRTSVFDRREVEALALRGRPRRSSRHTSIDLLIETRLTELTPQGVRYRGHPAGDLARTHRFEQVAELLWTGELPGSVPSWQGPRISVPAVSDPIAALQIAVAEMGALAHGSLGRDAGESRTAAGAAPGRDAASVAARGRWLIAGAVDALPAAGDGRCPRLVLGDGAPIRATIAGRLWTRLSPRRPVPGMLAVVNAALVLLADHDLAASTFAVRVAASTRADPCAVVSAGLGALGGPLHGGASVLARRLLADAATVGATRAVGDLLRHGERVPGFGHKVYTDTDPRATVLLGMLAGIPAAARIVQLVDDVHRAATDRTGKAPNVDLALAALGAANGMADDAGEAVMAVSRIAGWLAHAIEEYQEPPLRFRPRARFVG